MGGGTAAPPTCGLHDINLSQHQGRGSSWGEKDTKEMRETLQNSSLGGSHLNSSYERPRQVRLCLWPRPPPPTVRDSGLILSFVETVLFYLTITGRRKMTRNIRTSPSSVPFSFSLSLFVLRCESTVQLQRLAHSDSFCLILPPNLKSAIAAVTYMAEQLKKQDTDDSVRVDCRDARACRQRALTHRFCVTPNPQR